jgi:hypothetical protein
MSEFWALALKASIGAVSSPARSKDLSGLKELNFRFIFQVCGFVGCY